MATMPFAPCCVAWIYMKQADPHPLPCTVLTQQLLMVSAMRIAVHSLGSTCFLQSGFFVAWTSSSVAICALTTTTFGDISIQCMPFHFGWGDVFPLCASHGMGKEWCSAGQSPKTWVGHLSKNVIKDYSQAKPVPRPSKYPYKVVKKIYMGYYNTVWRV